MKSTWNALDGRSERGFMFDDWLARIARKLLAEYTGPSIEDYIVQNGITHLHSDVTYIRITANEPTTYALATTGSGSSQMLGFKSWGANNAIGADASGSPSGRVVASTAITDGTIVTTGTAGWWAATDEVSSRLLAHGSLSATQAVTAGNSFSLGSFTIRIPAQASG